MFREPNAALWWVAGGAGVMLGLVLLPGRREWGVADLLARALPDIAARAVSPSEGWTPADLSVQFEAETITVLVAAPTQLRALLPMAR